MPTPVSDVVAVLARHQQRATYGALAGVVGRLPQSVMHGLAKCPANSWVVSKQTGWPTGYAPLERDPGLLAIRNVLASPEELRTWLNTHT